MTQGAAWHFGSGKPFRDIAWFAWFDLSPSGRAVAGTVGSVEAFGDDPFVAGGDCGSEEGAAGADDAVGQGQFRDGQCRA